MKSILNKFNKVVMSAFLLILIFTGCVPKAHIVRVQYEAPPKFNTAGISRVAVMDFKAPSGSQLDREMAVHATEQARAAISGVPQFTVVNNTQIEQRQRAGQSIEDYVDALLTGQITRTSTNNSSERKERTKRERKDGEWVSVKENYTEYTTNVEVSYTYQLERARDFSTVGQSIQKNKSNRARSETGIPDPNPLIRSLITFEEVRSNYSAHPVSVSRTFATEEKSPDKILKMDMREAMQQAKLGNRNSALQYYLDIYAQHKNIAAALNVAILYEASNDVQSAISFLQQAYKETGNSQAQARISDINSRIQSTEMAREHRQIAGISQTDRVVAVAIEEVQKVLSKDNETKVWIHNNSPGNATAELVVDNMTADFIRNGIGLVERQHAALFFGEQELHISGLVADRDIVNIGNSAGANTIVVISITGTGTARRLSLRVLDVEKGAPIYQSDTGERWQL